MSSKNIKKNNMVIFLIPICVAINLVGGQIALLLKLPIYVDAIGTILAGALCGPVSGVVVGLISNVINAISLPSVLAFAFVNIALGLVASVVSKKGMLLTFPRALLASVAVWAVGFGISTVIYIFVFGGFSGDGLSVLVSLVMAVGFDMKTAVVICVALTELVDKLATVLIAWFIIKSMSVRMLVKFPYGYIYAREK